MLAVFRKPKTFKLRALHSQEKFGVAGRSCQEVLQKGCLHLQLPVAGSRLCLYEDGTELTGDYFWSVPDNSELVVLTSGQTWQGYVSDLSRFLSAFHKPHAGLIQAARQLLSDEQAPLRQKLLADLLHTVSENIAAETRDEDPPWFEGLESRFQSKSGYLRYSCESRIRSYLREVHSYASMVGVEARGEYSRVADLMCHKLRAAGYNGSYFDRGAKAGGRLCTPEGWFCCQGPFDVDTCASKHSINPYGNRESRVLFSTWNLDHIIEKKRTVVPALAEAITERDGREVAWEYFYGLLFTLENLKLVHIACHKKTTHRLGCDPHRIYQPQTKPKRRRPARKRR
ncbi:DNA fragmentation factor subunit beta isoform X1 [Ursus maritimus]|uniref:DNA fragmentation factor subunit beta n=1 Tax=Ursus maritimus TaxID=29073 RepID=A0A8M1H0R9_URSMA|nr:DNA fragmentation factor subunit beta isoform X1 [Ursus arctos]XP_040501611.1 DNA fragmentation factor subunit beta isoform X1 [Ursus maritimus]